jgi:hypothetical protein
LPDEAFEFGAACFIFISLTIAGEDPLGVLLMKLSPLDDGVGMQLMLAGRLRDCLSGFDFTDDLELELFGELASLESHGYSPLQRIPP